MKKLGMLTALLGFYMSISATASQTKGVTKATQRATPAAKEHFTVTTKTVKWGPPPRDMVVGTLPAEFQNQPPISVAVLSGDPTKPGVPFVLWIKNPRLHAKAHAPLRHGEDGGNRAGAWHRTFQDNLGEPGNNQREEAIARAATFCSGSPIVV